MHLLTYTVMNCVKNEKKRKEIYSNNNNNII